ncbi:MAG: tRNA (5-methylaminomethyl-2-thiouridine)(34)-methyltransferase MnmD [Thermaceae bacterium]|nr:tRNA (5-methylaminomethyl-2-thiouridine)(34)-methyltransferase MnmD [Thermaceae bacterium]
MSTEPNHFILVLTDDGSFTLVHPRFGVTYSSRHGALLQATELYLKLTGTHQHTSPRVLEVGFGLGVNFRVTLQDAINRGVKLAYLSYESFSVSRKVLESVPVALSPRAEAVWQALLEAWPDQQPAELDQQPAERLQQPVEATNPRSAPITVEGEWGSLEIRLEDVTRARFPGGWATAIYLDPFDADVNPEPWSPRVLQKLYAAAQPNACLATYSVAGPLRRGLEEAGFSVQKVDLREYLPQAKKRFWLRALVLS